MTSQRVPAKKNPDSSKSKNKVKGQSEGKKKRTWRLFGEKKDKKYIYADSSEKERKNLKYQP